MATAGRKMGNALCRTMTTTQSSEAGTNLYARNLPFLPAYLVTQLEQLKPEEIWKRVDVVYNDEGMPICRYTTHGVLRHISRRDPVRQTRQWLQQLPLGSLSTVFLFGGGFGYVLSELAASTPGGTRILVFEPNIYMFAAMLQCFDLSDILSSHRFAFFVGDLQQVSTAFLEFSKTTNLYYLTAPSIVFAPETRLNKESYLRMQHRVLDLLTEQVFRLGNDQSDSMLGFHNMVENAAVGVNIPPLKTIRNKFHRFPIFIVANGPSLDVNIHELRRIGNQGLILCCESAIVPLLRNGIHPDAVIVAERTPASYQYHFHAVQYPENVVLLALSVADPRIFKAFTGPQISIFRSAESTSQWLNALLGNDDAVTGGVNVSHMAFELAVYMGGDPVILVGQDLAFGSHNMTHSKDSKYVESAQDYIEGIQKSGIIYVEGNAGVPVRSTAAWDVYRKGLEQLIAKSPQLTVINATAGGARIQGTRNDDLAKVIDEFCRCDPPQRLASVIDAAQPRVDDTDSQKKLQQLMMELKQFAQIYRALGRFTAIRRSKCEQVVNALDAIDVKISEEWLNREFVHNQTELFKFSQPNVHTLFFQQVIIYGFHQINKLGSLNTQPKVRQAFVAQYETFNCLHLICTDLVRNFSLAADRVAVLIPSASSEISAEQL